MDLSVDPPTHPFSASSLSLSLPESRLSDLLASLASVPGAARVKPFFPYEMSLINSPILSEAAK